MIFFQTTVLTNTIHNHSSQTAGIGAFSKAEERELGQADRQSEDEGVWDGGIKHSNFWEI